MGRLWCCLPPMPTTGNGRAPTDSLRLSYCWSSAILITQAQASSRKRHGSLVPCTLLSSHTTITLLISDVFLSFANPSVTRTMGDACPALHDPEPSLTLRTRCFIFVIFNVCCRMMCALSPASLDIGQQAPGSAALSSSLLRTLTPPFKDACVF